MAIQKALYVNNDGDYQESTGMYETDDFLDSSAGAQDAGKPVKLNSSGLIDSTMLDPSTFDHGSLVGLEDDDHTQYLALDSNLGSRGGVQTITGDLRVQDPATDTSIANKQYVDSVAEGLAPKQAVKVASTADIPGSLASGVFTSTSTATSVNDIDGVLDLAIGDRILLKDQLTDSQNGIYEVTTLADGVSQALVLTRAADMDSDSPINEVNGAYVPVQEGTNNAGKFFVQTETLTTIDTDPINFVFFNAVASGVSGGDGISVSSGEVSVDLQVGGGLKIDATQLAVEPADIIGNGLIESPDDTIAIDFASVLTIDNADAKALSADSLASTDNAKGASIVGIEDVSAYYAGSDLESVLNEIEAQIGGLTSSTFAFTEDNVLADNDAIYPALNKLDEKFGELFASDTALQGANLIGIEDSASNFVSTSVEGALLEVADRISTSESDIVDLFNSLDRDGAIAGEAISAGDLLYISANDTVSILDITSSQKAVGVALSGASLGQTVQYSKFDEVVSSVFPASSGVAGTRYYWDGTQITNSIPSGAGNYVWQIGIAKNADDMLTSVEFIKRNSL